MSTRLAREGSGVGPVAVIATFLRHVVGTGRGIGSVNAALLDQAVVSLSNFLGNVLVARALGLTDFGVYSLAWMGLLFLNSLQIGAITAPMMSLGPKRAPDSRPAYFGALLVHACGSALITGLALLAAGTMIAIVRGGDAYVPALALATSGVAFQLQDFVRRYYFVTDRPRRALFSDGISYVGQLMLIATLASTGGLTIGRALWCIALTSMLGSSLVLFEAHRVRVSTGMIRTVWQEHWSSGKWLTGSAVLQWFSGNQLFTVAAAVSVGAAGAGAMKAAQNIMGVLHILFQGLENALPSEAAKRLHTGGVTALIRYIERFAAVTGVVTLMVVCAAFFAPHFWLNLLYGPPALEYAFVLRWYAVIYLLVFIGTPLRACLRALETTRPIFWSTALATVFSIATAHVLTEQLGLGGAMVGIALSFLVMQATLWFGTVRQLRASLAPSMP